MNIEDRKRLMTPSGRPPVMAGEYRPPGPKQNLVPLTPPWPPPPWETLLEEEGATPTQAPSSTSIKAGRVARQGQNVDPTSELMTTAVPKLDSPFVLNNNQINIPWQQLIVNLWRLAQPTGVTPGTFAGITFNAFGQAVGATTGGATFENVTLTGTPTAPTPSENDNSNAIATTAWVRLQNYITEAFVNAQGFATEQFVTSQGFATQSFVLGQGFITDAPHDGNIYARQNGSWVVVTAVPPEGTTGGAGD